MKAIQVENLGKEYRLGIINHGTLKHDLQSWWSRVRGKQDPNKIINQSDNKLDFWALQNVSFDINVGESVGIIGKNGAGKSTLLKILSRVTTPTTGAVKVRGKIASLLEVGTGFNPELTGRENIYMNGAILGLTKKDISLKLDEIIDFSGIGPFIDTPVKRYSSGMYVRLAFAVAAHLEPDILIVDEVLAVGDADFQKKCLGKMGEVGRDGRTIIFVSHNMAAIAALCKTTILLMRGKVDFVGDAETGISRYLTVANSQTGKIDFDSNTPERTGPKHFAKFLYLQTLNSSNETCGTFKMGDDIKIRIGLEICEKVPDIELMIYFNGFMDAYYGMYSTRTENFFDFRLGVQEIELTISANNLLPGDWAISLWISSGRQPQDDLIPHASRFQIMANNLITGIYVDYDRYKHYGILQRGSWKNL